MSAIRKPPRLRTGPGLIISIAVGAASLIVLSVLVLLRVRPWETLVPGGSVPSRARGNSGFDGDYSTADSVSIVLGAAEAAQGLRHLADQSDGLTAVESIVGVSARVLRLPEKRDVCYYYFQIHPTFKQADVRGARIDVEFLALAPGTLSLHYDALDAEDVSNPRYRQASSPVRLSGSTAWRSATFRTRNDAQFGNRQNGQADFRLAVKAPILYVRRVTVTRETNRGEEWTVDYSTSNSVTVALGQEKSEDGVRHRADEGDGRTRVEDLEGVRCRHLNRVAENKTFGYAYFALSPTFKREGLNQARVDIEYFAPRPASFRLQFDGLRDEARHRYITALPPNAPLVKFGPRIDYARIPVVGAWAVATFHMTNAVFRNGQNGDSDFRLEVVPPDIYLRRVTVTRENALPAPSSGGLPRPNSEQ